MVSVTLSTIAAVAAALAGLGQCAPLETRQNSISVTYYGAANAQFSQTIPFTSTFSPVDNALSISHIAVSGGPCAFFGVDGAVVFNAGGKGYYDVGPPQTIVGGICGPIPGSK